MKVFRNLTIRCRIIPLDIWRFIKILSGIAFLVVVVLLRLERELAAALSLLVLSTIGIFITVTIVKIKIILIIIGTFVNKVGINLRA